MKGLRENQHRCAAAFLEERLNVTAPGGRLPALRELCLASGTKRDVMRGELELLECRGRVKIVPRRGIFRSRGRNNTVQSEVWLFYDGRGTMGGSHGFVYEIFHTFELQTAADGVALKVARLTPEMLLRWPEFLRRNHVERLLLYGATHDWFREIASRYCEHVVEVLPRHTVSSGFAVVDSPEMSLIQLEYLFRLGHRRIGYIHNAELPRETSPVQHERLAAYYRIMAEHGLPVHPEWVFSGYCPPGVFGNRFHRMTGGAHPVSAVIVSGGFLPELYRTARAQLCEPGRDLGVMGCDEITDILTPEPTTVTNSPGDIARAAWRLLDDSVRGERPRIERSELRIHTGNTVGRISADEFTAFPKPGSNDGPIRR